jgi:hypothetical protein
MSLSFLEEPRAYRGGCARDVARLHCSGSCLALFAAPRAAGPRFAVSPYVVWIATPFWSFALFSEPPADAIIGIHRKKGNLMARNMTRPQSGEQPSVTAKRPNGAGRKVGAGEKIDADELRQRIAQSAYYRAQNRGFAPGYEEKDWLEAEAEIKGKPGPRPATT